MTIAQAKSHAVAVAAVALVAVAVTAALRQLLDPLLGQNRPFIFFFAAVTIAAWYGGLWAGVASVVLSYLVANWLFIPPYHALTFNLGSPLDWANLLSFIAISAVIVGLIEAMRRAEMKAAAHAVQVRLLLDKAEEADRRKDVFLATLAHELRNPLAPLSNALQLWSLRAPDAAGASDLRGIMSRQVRQMARLIDDLMDVSRIKHGRIQLHRAHRPLRPLIENAVEAARPLVDHFQHQLQVQQAPEPIWVDGDPARLTQVFTNLLINAAKHSGTGCNISIRSLAADGRAVICITDDGAGIAQDMLTRIFEPFAQAEASRERFYAGLGIGLALVKQLILLHGGTVEARSGGPGKGSEFIVSLPTVAPVDAQTDGAAVSFASGGQPAAVFPPHRVIVADDVVASATTLGQLLQALGQDVIVAHDGPATIRAASVQHADLAIIDIGMPGMDGYEVARRLRANPATQHMLLVALTGYGQDEDRARAMAAGFDQHLTKPAGVKALQRLLETLSARQPAGQS